MNLSLPITAAALAFAALFIPVRANGQTLGEYDFEGLPFDIPPSFEHPNVSVGDIIPVPGWLLSDGILQVTPSIGVVSADTAVEQGFYFQFTLTPDLGSAINYESISFDTGNTLDSPGQGYVVRSSVDGFATNLAAATVPAFENVTISLAGEAFQGVTDAVSFRIYSYGIFLRWRSYDNLSINGTVVPVPEPTAAS